MLLDEYINSTRRAPKKLANMAKTANLAKVAILAKFCRGISLGHTLLERRAYTLLSVLDGLLDFRTKK